MANVGKWLLYVKPVDDPITDTPVTYAFVDGDPEGTLVVRCEDETLIVYVNWKRELARDSDTCPVIYRFGLEPARKEQWKLLDIIEHQINTAPTLQTEFINKLYWHNRLVVRATDMQQQKITLTFDIRGADQAVKQVYEMIR